LLGIGARGDAGGDRRAVGRQEGFDDREGVADGGRGARGNPERSQDFDALPQCQPPPEIGRRRRRRCSFKGQDQAAVGQKDLVFADILGPDAGGAQQLGRITAQFGHKARIARQRCSTHH
jgi:hypothetical protein